MGKVEVSDILCKFQNSKLSNEESNIENNITKYSFKSDLVRIQIRQLCNNTIKVKRPNPDGKYSFNISQVANHLSYLKAKEEDANIENSQENLHLPKNSLYKDNKISLRSDSDVMNNTMKVSIDNHSQSNSNTISAVTTDGSVLKTENSVDDTIATSNYADVTNHSRSPIILPNLNFNSTLQNNFELDLRTEATTTNMILSKEVIEPNSEETAKVVSIISVPLNFSSTSLPPYKDKFANDSSFYTTTTTVANSFKSKSVSPKIKSSNIQTTLVGAENPILTQNNVSFYFNDFSSSVVISVGLSFAIALLLFVVMTLWIIRRRKYHSKVYLSYELAKPSRYISKPLPPSILPGEIILDNHSVYENDNPREPLHLQQCQQDRGISTGSNIKYFSSLKKNCDSGIDNPAYVGARIGENSSNKEKEERPAFKTLKKENIKNRRPVPKYTKRRKSGIEFPSPKVCSSDGSIFHASPSLTRCLVPPPPYSPSIRNESKLIFTLPNGPGVDNKSLNKECESSN